MGNDGGGRLAQRVGADLLTVGRRRVPAVDPATARHTAVEAASPGATRSARQCSVVPAHQIEIGSPPGLELSALRPLGMLRTVLSDAAERAGVRMPPSARSGGGDMPALVDDPVHGCRAVRHASRARLQRCTSTWEFRIPNRRTGAKPPARGCRSSTPRRQLPFTRGATAVRPTAGCERWPRRPARGSTRTPPRTRGRGPSRPSCSSTRDAYGTPGFLAPATVESLGDVCPSLDDTILIARYPRSGRRRPRRHHVGRPTPDRSPRLVAAHCVRRTTCWRAWRWHVRRGAAPGVAHDAPLFDHVNPTWSGTATWILPYLLGRLHTHEPGRRDKFGARPHRDMAE